LRDRRYRRAFYAAVLQQIAIILVTALILDGGATNRRFRVLAAVFWATVFPISLLILPRSRKVARLALYNGTWILVISYVAARVVRV
jgi:amino acid permease